MEILHRGKRKDNGEWLIGKSMVCAEGHCYITTGGAVFGDYANKSGVTYLYGVNKPFLIEVDPKTICAYVGREDDYGKKIFEGDLLRGFYRGDKLTCKVKFNREMCAFACYYDTVVGPYGEKATYTIWIKDLEHAVVVGNIYDSQEGSNDRN